MVKVLQLGREETELLHERERLMLVLLLEVLLCLHGLYLLCLQHLRVEEECLLQLVLLLVREGLLLQVGEGILLQIGKALLLLWL